MSGPVRVVAAGFAVLVLTATGALAAAPPGSPLWERRYHASDAVYAEAAKAVERDPACRPRANRAPPTDEPPSAAMLRALAPLRRPARADELAALDALGFFPHLPLPGVYRNHVRVLHAADGTAFTLIPFGNTILFKSRPEHCVAELRTRFERAIADRRAAFRRYALRYLRRQIRSAWIAPPAREGLGLFTPGGGSFTALADFLRNGFRSGGYGGRDATIHLLVPDGVASVDLVFRRFEPTGYWSTHHPVVMRTTASVQDNLASGPAPAELRDSTLVDQVWRAADGTVINTVGG
jgi:hypothetical protein